MADKDLTEQFPRLAEALGRWGQRYEAEYKDQLIAHKKNATYDLLDSVEYLVKSKGQAMEMGLSLNDYWAYLEGGRPAGRWAPVAAIRRWVMAKPVKPYSEYGTKPSVNAIAFLVNRKIFIKGIAAVPMMQWTDERLNADMMADIEAALDEDIEALRGQAVEEVERYI